MDCEKGEEEGETGRSSRKEKRRREDMETETGREAERRGEVGKAHPLKGNVVNAQVVLLLPAAEKVSHQDLEGRPAQMSEY